MNPLNRIKEEQKSRVKNIRAFKLAWKQAYRDKLFHKKEDESWRKYDARYNEWKKSVPPSDSREFRHWHIAYCEVRGRTRDQIEKPHESNKPSEFTILKYKEQILKELKEWHESLDKDYKEKENDVEENVCSSS